MSTVERFHESLQFAKQLETKYAQPISASVAVFEAAIEAVQTLTSLQADVATWNERRSAARAEAEATAELAIRARETATQQITALNVELGELGQQVHQARNEAQAAMADAAAKAQQSVAHAEAQTAARLADLTAQTEAAEAVLAKAHADYADFRAKVL